MLALTLTPNPNPNPNPNLNPTEVDAAPVLRDACVLCTVGQILEPADTALAADVTSACG